MPNLATTSLTPSHPVAPVATSPTYETFLAGAGMPTATFTKQRTYDPLRDRERWDADMGRIAHEVIGTLAQDCQNRPADQVRTLIADALRGRRLPGRGDRSYLRLSGLIGAYMHLHLPHSPATFIGREYPLDGGRADLVWHHPAHGTFVDEVKTWRRARWEDAAEQIDRYMRGGTTAFSDFAGVRFVSLGNAKASVWITNGGELKRVNLRG